MKRSRSTALSVTLLGVSLLLGCQYVLGIHGGTPEGPETPTGGTGATPFASVEDTGGRAAPWGSAGSAGLDADGEGRAAGAGIAGRDRGGGGGISAGASQDASTLDEAGREGGGRGGRGGDGAGNSGGAPRDDAGQDQDAGSAGGVVDGRPASEGAVCATPWRASAVPAHLWAVSAGGSTACGFAGRDLPMMVAALDTANFRAAAACGACLRVRNVTNTASVVVPVLESSGSGGVLLSRAAMDELAPGANAATVDWALVACDVGTSPVRYRIKDGTTASYLAVQIRNARYPLSSVSIVTTGGLLPLTLRTDGAWETSGAGTGPVTFRLTDINGQSFDDPNVRLAPQSEAAGKGQFPVCR